MSGATPLDNTPLRVYRDELVPEAPIEKVIEPVYPKELLVYLESGNRWKEFYGAPDINRSNNPIWNNNRVVREIKVYQDGRVEQLEYWA